MDKSISTRWPQQEDGVRELLARTLGGAVRGTILASAARTATTSGAEFNAINFRGLLLFLNITSASGTGGLRPAIDYIDPVSGSWRSMVLLNGAAITATGLFVFAVGPGMAGGSGYTVNSGGFVSLPLASRMRVSTLHSDATSYTYSMGFELC